MELVKLILLLIIVTASLFLIFSFLESLLKRSFKEVSKEIYKTLKEAKEEVKKEKKVHYQVRDGKRILREFKSFEEAQEYLKSFSEEERENMFIVEVRE